MNKHILSLLFFCLSFDIILSESILWQAQFSGESDPAFKTSFAINKGSFFKLNLHLTTKTTDYPLKAKGRLLLSDDLSKDFIISNEVVIDTNESRTYSIFIGVLCGSTMETKSYSIKFKLDTKDDELIEWTNINLELKNTKEQFEVLSLINPINSNSFAPYFIQHVNKDLQIRNVDKLSIQFKNVAGGSMNAGVIDDFSVDHFEYYERNLLQLKGYYSGGLFEKADIEFSATIQSNNECFEPKEKTFKWTVSNVNQPAIAQYDPKEIVAKAEEVQGVGNTAYLNLVIDPYPLLISCGASGRGDYTFLDQESVTNQDKYVYKYHFDLLYYQTFSTHEGKIPIVFKGANRFAKHFNTVCYLQTIRNDRGKKDFSDTLKVSFDKENDNAKIIIKAEDPVPSQCAMWEFDTDMKAVFFGEKAVEYCHSYFGGKKSALSEIGCFICEERSPDFFTYQQKSLCMRSNVDCPTSFIGDLKAKFDEFVRTIDTKEKIVSQLKLDNVGNVVKVTHSSDKDQINLDLIATNIIEITPSEVVLQTISIMDQTLSCLVKDLNTQYFSKVTEDDFFTKSTRAISLIPGKILEYEVEFKSDAGYDSQTYSLVLMCYNLAQYQYHYYNSKPFITVSILKTEKKPIIDPKVDPEKCADKPFSPNCLPFQYRDSGVDITRYNSQLPDDLLLFRYLPPGYKRYKIEDEIEELNKLADKAAINDKIILLGELLGKMVCSKENDYKKCREYKASKIPGLIDKISTLYKSNIEKEIQFNAHIDINVPILSYMVFALSNNADGFKDIAVVNQLSRFTHEVVSQYKKLVALIMKREIKLEEKTKSVKDFYSILVLHHINLFEIYHFLEADAIIKRNEKTQMIEALDDLKQIKADFELLLFYMKEADVTSFSYDDIFILYSQTQQKQIEMELEPNINKVPFTFMNGTKISIEPVDLFKNNKDLQMIQMFYLSKHPFMSINTTDYYPNTVSLRFIGGNNANYDTNTIDPLPEIFFNVTGLTKKFEEGFEIDAKKYGFNSENCNWKSVNENSDIYSVISVSKVGDYTVGLSQTSSWLWLIIVCSVLAVAVIGGISYLIWMIMKNKKRRKISIENVDPLMATG